MESEALPQLRGAHWLLQALVPRLALVEPDDAEAISQACQALAPACGSSLMRLLDARRGTRRAVEYLTPTLKLSQVFRFRVVPAAEVGGALSRSLDSELYQVVASAKPEPGRLETPFPWFANFRQKLFQATLFWDEIAKETGSQLHMPLGVFFAVHASEKDPAVALQRMQERCSLPAGIPRLILIVQDPSTTEDVCQISERLVRGEFGAENVCILRLHSEKAFEESYHEALSRIVMATQKRIFTLHEAVGSHRKGLSNTFRSLFSSGYPASSSSRPSAGGQRGPKVYNFESQPYKVRCLADLLFWMHDYDTALQNYASLRDDYAKDEAYLHLGHANEMVAICSFLSKGPSPTVEEGAKRVDLIERAVDSYSRAVPITLKAESTPKQIALGHRLATRASLLLLDIAPRNGYPSMKVMTKPLSHEDELCAAILLEQISLLMVDQGVAQRGMRRKSGFNGFFAGSLFRSLGLDKHAWRCYLSVYQNVRGKGWNAAEHHLEVNLGNLCRNLGDMKGFIEYRGRCLQRGFEITNSNQHKNFLAELCEAINVAELKVNLPFVLPAVVDVQKPCAACDQIMRTADSQTKSVWESSEKHLETFLKIRRRPNEKIQVYALEPLFIEVSFRNPLNCPLTIYDASLMLNEEGDAKIILADPLTLAPKETRSLSLALVPQVENRQLTLTGVKWKLVSGHESFISFHFASGPFVVKVLPAAPSLVPASRPTTFSNSDTSIRITMKNEGASTLQRGTRLLIGSSILAEVEWMSSSNATGEIVDEQGLIQQINVDSDVAPGQTLELIGIISKPQLSSTVPIVMMVGDTRFTRIALHGLSNAKAANVDVSARALKSASGDLLLVVDLESQNLPIRPLALSSFSNSHILTPLSAVMDLSQSAYTRRWSLVARVLPGTGSSFVSLDRTCSKSAFAALGPEDFSLRSHHAHQVYFERLEAQRKYEREKAEMQARGQLPVTIQDVRRARQRGELNKTPNIVDEHHPPGSSMALQSTTNMIHLAVEFTYPDGSMVDRAFATRIQVDIPPVSVHISHTLPRLLVLRENDDVVEVPVQVRIKNNSSKPLPKVRVSMNAQSQLVDHFPVPMQWLGPLRTFRKLDPEEEQVLCFSAVFASAGVYGIGPARAEVIHDEDTTPDVQAISEVFHLTIARESKEETPGFAGPIPLTI